MSTGIYAVGQQPKPIFHDQFLVGQRVEIYGMSHDLDGLKGKIVGIAVADIVHCYIVKLDECIPAPKAYPGEPWECISVMGGCLKLLS